MFLFVHRTLHVLYEFLFIFGDKIRRNARILFLTRGDGYVYEI